MREPIHTTAQPHHNLPLTVVFQLFVCFQHFTLEYQSLLVQWYTLHLWNQTSLFNSGTTSQHVLSSLPPKYAKPWKQLQDTSIGIVSFQQKDPPNLINLLDFPISRVCLAMHIFFFSFVCCFSPFLSWETHHLFNYLFFQFLDSDLQNEAIIWQGGHFDTVNHPPNRPNLPLLGDQSQRFHHLVPSLWSSSLLQVLSELNANCPQ